MTEHRFDDRRMESIMGRLLQFGVLLASLVVAIGGVLYVRSHAHDAIHYRTFVSRPVDLHHLGSLVPGVFRGNGTAIIETGVLLLIATRLHGWSLRPLHSPPSAIVCTWPSVSLCSQC